LKIEEGHNPKAGLLQYLSGYMKKDNTFEFDSDTFFYFNHKTLATQAAVMSEAEVMDPNNKMLKDKLDEVKPLTPE